MKKDKNMQLKIIFFTFLLQTTLLFSLEEESLIFYHIPRTGGTTIDFLLKGHFPQEVICPDRYYFQIENRTVEDLKKFQFFSGHFFFNSNLKDLNHVKRIVFLRDPVQRVLSEQRFLNLHEKKSPGEGNFIYKEHFIQQGQPIHEVSNHQCLFLSSYDRNDPTITPQMHLKSAKENLRNHFYFIGITENMKESLKAIYRLFGWKLPRKIPRCNHTDSIELDVDAKLLEEIRLRNLQDIELYEYAKSLYKYKLRKIIKVKRKND